MFQFGKYSLVAFAAADNWNEQLHTTLEGTKEYSLYSRLLRVRDVSEAHGKPIDFKVQGARKSDRVRRMSTELANLFQANGLEPFHTVTAEGKGFVLQENNFLCQSSQQSCAHALAHFFSHNNTLPLMSTVMCTHLMLPKSTAMFTYLNTVHVSQQHIATQSCALALAHLFCHNNTLPLMSTVLCTQRMSPKSTALFTYLSTVHVSQQHIATHVNSSVHLPVHLPDTV